MTEAMIQSHQARRIEELIHRVEVVARELAGSNNLSLRQVDVLERAVHTIHISDLQRVDILLTEEHAPRRDDR